MAELPSGTVTFLFTDIEGSTTRWEHQPEAMRVALARHDALLRAAIDEHGGHVVKTMGDAFHAAFAALRTRSRRRWTPSAGSRPSRGARSARCGCGWRCTPARPRSATATTTARR